MRIEAYNQIQANYKSAKTIKTAGRAGGSFTDQLQISALGRDIQVAKAALARQPEVRQDKVDALRARIEAGTYSVDLEDWAARLLS